LRREVIHLVRLIDGQDADQARQVGEVAIDEFHILQDAEPAQPLANHVGRGRTAHQAYDLVTLAQQELG
jgi:superfamily II helicase